MTMQIKQFEDKNLSHYSYAIVSDCEKKIVLVDPARDVRPYMEFAKDAEAKIVAVIETHPHADFVSSHLELHQLTGAIIYTSQDVHAAYPHQGFDDGQAIDLGKIKLSAINTPGHSPDGISILLEHDGRQKAVFTGDTLFVGDCGRPDLREVAGKIQTTRHELAKMMFHSLRDKLMVLEDNVIVYPAHGAGTLCGKSLSKESSSTIVNEKETNWSLQDSSEEEFVQNLLADQPFVPAYFPFDVELNRNGAVPMHQAISNIAIEEFDEQKTIDENIWVVDTRKESDFKKGHLPHSVNLMEKGKFETWLGSIIKPNEPFWLVGESKESVTEMLTRTACIGYESFVKGAFIISGGAVTEEEIDVEQFRNHTDNYTIVDVRNDAEVKEGKVFPNSISIPLAEIRDRVNEIPTDKPIVVHCAGGYRSAAASSIIRSKLNASATVLDLSEAVNDFASHQS